MTDCSDVVVCADDFGLSSGVDDAILSLLASGAINATTCLTGEASWPADVRRLRALDRGLLGLHLALPSPFTPAPEALTLFRRQWAAFVDGVGRAPDFVDGHRHVHLFPGPGRALFLLLAEEPARPWLRQCRTSSSRLIAKRAVLDPLSLGFRNEARRRGYGANPGFGGLRRFDPQEDIARIWRRDVEAMAGGGLLMVHPGWSGDADALSACRSQEAAVLADGAVRDLLAGAGLTLAQGEPSWARR